MEQKLSTGRIVHFVLGDGTVRPAIVTQAWSETCANLRVFLDGSNDTDNPRRITETCEFADGTKYANPVCDKDGWATSVSFDGNESPRPRSWHWPPRV